MGEWKKKMADFMNTINAPIYGAGFVKEGTEVSSHPNLITFDGVSAYFFGLQEHEASDFLDGLTVLNGYMGWLAYILQELFFDESSGEELYEEIYDGLNAGIIKPPQELSRETLYQWVDSVAPQVERIKRRLEQLPGAGI
ncbi:MAG: hypothetical protein ACYDEQ_12410 [Desulfocucumaceae bacterium]